MEADDITSMTHQFDTEMDSGKGLQDPDLDISVQTVGIEPNF